MHVKLLRMPHDATSILKALPGKLDIKRLSPSIPFISPSHAMSTSVLKALPGKLDIKKHSPGILYGSASLAFQQAFSKPCLVNLISKDTHLVFLIYNAFWFSVADMGDQVGEPVQEIELGLIPLCTELYLWTKEGLVNLHHLLS